MTYDEYIKYAFVPLRFSEVDETSISWVNTEYGITARCALTCSDNYRANFVPKMLVAEFEPEELEIS